MIRLGPAALLAHEWLAALFNQLHCIPIPALFQQKGIGNARGIPYPFSSKVDQTQADHQRFVDPIHHFLIQMGDFVGQTLFINRANLLQQNHRVPIKPVGFGVDLHMGGQLGLLNLSGNRGDDHGGAKPIAYIVLDDQNRPDPTLFRSNHW